MISKKGFVIFGMLVLAVLSLVMVSATTSTVLTIDNIDAPTSQNEDSGTFTFTFNITYAGTSASETIDLSGSTINFGSVSMTSPTGLDGTVSGGTEVEVTATVSGFASQGGNDLIVSLNASTTSEGFDDEKKVTVKINEIIDLCPFGEVGDLEISDFNIDNEGTGDDEEWNPLDELIVEVEVENTDNDDSVSDVLVELFIFDEDDNDVTNDFDLEDEEEDLGRIKDDDEETATFTIQELPADLDEGKYRLYIKAYEDGEEETHCASESSEFNEGDEYFEFEYVREEDVAVVVRDQDVNNQITAMCGDDNVQINFPVYNIGDDKEESVLVNLYNADLGVDEFYQIDNLRSGKKAGTTFFVNVPQDAQERVYKLDIFTFFDYDDDEDELSEFSYDSNSFDDLSENWQVQLDVIGCSTSSSSGTNIPAVTATLDSQAMLGEELVIKTIVQNPGSAGTYLITATGLEGWADLVSVTPQSLNLASGASGEVMVKLNPTTEGFQTFAIETFRDGKMYTQPVSVNIAGEQGALSTLGDKALYYIVGVLVVLIILILVVIIAKLGRGSRSRESF